MITTRTSPASIAIEGYVERLDAVYGVEGWAVDRNDPARSLALELCAGDLVLARTNTGVARPDVCAALGIDARPGFRFDKGVRDVIRSTAADGLTRELVVRVPDGLGRVLLPGTSKDTDIALPVEKSDRGPTQQMLLDLLAIHARTAQHALDRALPPLAEAGSGVLEELSTDEDGILWVSGWLIDDGIVDRPVIIVDGDSYAAGFACVHVRRDDLAIGCVGFLGILHTDWRPSSMVLPTLIMADVPTRILEPLIPASVRTKQAMKPLITHYLVGAEGRFRDALRDLFHNAANWTPPESRSAADLLQIDEVAIVPGFGTFVKGWALSATKDVDHFSAKIGSRVISADPRSISRHGRSDLATVYPGLVDTTDTAGFVATFRGAFDPADVSDLIVKLTWSDGSSVNDRAIPEMVRVIGMTAPLEAAYRFYPDLEFSYFFNDFAHHAAITAHAHAGETLPYKVRSATEVLILSVPASSSDLFLMYDNLLRCAALLPSTWGIVILAAADHLRPLVVSLVADVERETARATSLFFMRRGRPTSDAIDSILDALGAVRFGYVGAHTVLTPEGWRAIGLANDGVWLLDATDPAASPTLSRDCDAFVTSSDRWRILTARAAPRIGGVDLAHEGGTTSTVLNAGFVLARRSSSPLVARINRANDIRRD